MILIFYIYFYFLKFFLEYLRESVNLYGGVTSGYAAKFDCKGKISAI